MGNSVPWNPSQFDARLIVSVHMFGWFCPTVTHAWVILPRGAAARCVPSHAASLAAQVALTKKQYYGAKIPKYRRVGVPNDVDVYSDDTLPGTPPAEYSRGESVDLDADSTEEFAPLASSGDVAGDDAPATDRAPSRVLVRVPP